MSLTRRGHHADLHGHAGFDGSSWQGLSARLDRQRGLQNRLRVDGALADQAGRRNAFAETGRIPTEHRIEGTSPSPPGKSGRKTEPGELEARPAQPSEIRAIASQARSDRRTQVEGEANVDALGSLYAIFDKHPAILSVHDHIALMDRLHCLPGIAVMARGPPGDAPGVKATRLDESRFWRIQPQERPARTGLILAANPQGVVGECRSEVPARLRIGQIAVGSGIRQNIDAAVAKLDG